MTRSGREPDRWWPAWGVLVMGSFGLVGLFGRVMIDWPSASWPGFVIGAAALPLAAVLSRNHRTARRGPDVLVATGVASGLVLLVCAMYGLVVLVLGRRPEDGERGLFALCLTGTVLACMVVGPARRRLQRLTRTLVYGDSERADDALASFGSRMTRALPMDELLLQLAETLQASLDLSTAEIWTHDQGRLVRAVSVPEARSAVIALGQEAADAAVHANAQGNVWLEMWLPQMLEGRRDLVLRSVPIRHQGRLSGLLLLTRPAGHAPFTPEQDRLLRDLVRPLGVALHNVRLDSALQASIEALHERNAELVASRARIVAVADEARRTIERDLHDGAQQHLVAIAAKIGAIRQMIDADADAAIVHLGGLADDVTSAIEEFRELAHGIYPPRLRDRGLAEALQAAADRLDRPSRIEVNGVGRLDADVEAALYFCCLEAMHNAAKYAGADAVITVGVNDDNGSLRVVVTDDGDGFDPQTVAAGHGLTNMRDRLGAIGGELHIESVLGSGTTIRGVVPLGTTEARTGGDDAIEAGDMSTAGACRSTEPVAEETARGSADSPSGQRPSSSAAPR